MTTELHVDLALKYYNTLISVKPHHLQNKYPYINMDQEQLTKTMKEIELTYQHLQGYFTDSRRPKRGGGPGKKIIIFTL